MSVSFSVMMICFQSLWCFGFPAVCEFSPGDVPAFSQLCFSLPERCDSQPIYFTIFAHVYQLFLSLSHRDPLALASQAGSKLPSRVPLPACNQLALFLRRGVPIPWTPYSPPLFPTTAWPGGEELPFSHPTPRPQPACFSFSGGEYPCHGHHTPRLFF